MKKNVENFAVYVGIGLILIMVSCLALFYHEIFLMRVFDLLGIILILRAGLQCYEFVGKKDDELIGSIVTNLLLGIFVLVYTDIPVTMIVHIFAFYIVLNATIRFISFINYLKDREKNRIYLLITALLFSVIGIAIILYPMAGMEDVTMIIAIYGLFLGVTYIMDGVWIVTPRNKRDLLKRKIRINIPIVIAAMMPRFFYDTVNRHLEVENDDSFFEDNPDAVVDLEIFVHASSKGFGNVGHVDICYRDQVITYGNYDYASTYFHEMLGDGVLIVTSKDDYIPFCIEESGKMIFCYGLKLTNDQNKEIQKEIEKLKANIYPWYPPSHYDSSIQEDYASRLNLKMKANFYKFKKGKFKTYFVLGTNCVLLADEIIGKSGTDMLGINGIICPGAYLTYLDKEYQRANSQVISKKVFHKEDTVHN